MASGDTYISRRTPVSISPTSGISYGGDTKKKNTYISRRTPVSIAPTGKISYGRGGGGSPGVPAGSTSSQVLETQKAKVEAVYDPATKTNIAQPLPPSLSQVQQKSNVQIPVNQVYKNSERPSEIPSEKKPIPTPKRTGVFGAYDSMNIFLKTKVTQPAFSFITRKTGLDPTDIKTQALFSPSLLGVGSFGFKPKPSEDIVAGMSAGILKDVRDKPGKQVLLFGAGAGVGYVAEGVVTGANLISPTLGVVTKTGVTVGGLALGGYYTYETGKDVVSSKTLSEAGGKLGVGGKDLFLFGKGYSTGSKGFTMTRGYYNTRGRTYLETEQGEFPTAPVKTQKGLFEKNIIPELGEKPGGFHTTSDVFWNKDIKFVEGASELPGGYVSTQVSTPFSRIPGSGSSTSFKFKKWLKTAVTPTGKPGVAYLQPEGFRNVKVGFSKIKQFEGQVETKQGYAFFKTPKQEGFADIPGFKTEIEAVFRVGAGDYALSNQKYYTTINRVRVPVDSFVFKDTGNIYASRKGKVSDYLFEPKDYSYSSSSSPQIFSIISSPPSSSSTTSSSIPGSSTPSSYSPPSYSPPSSPTPTYSPPSSTTSSYSPPSSPPPSSPPPSPPPFMPLTIGGLGFLRTKKYAGKKRFKYTPSYEAFTLGIKGKKPTGIETGLRTRPITPGFSLFNKKSGISAFRGFKGFSGFKGSNFKGLNFGTKMRTNFRTNLGNTFGFNFGTKKKKKKKK